MATKKVTVPATNKAQPTLYLTIVQGNFLDIHYTDNHGYAVSEKLLPDSFLTIPDTPENRDSLKPFADKNLIKITKK